ncbi:MAG: NAD(P)H nitroreductase [Mycobacteriaceae bacterium]|nr:NAD(P)H nitroreductase [Mycobacteriaceae bacterium]
MIERAVYLACRAPSLHNSQPWRWVAEGAVVDLFCDPTRIGRSTDHTGREIIISCGAVLDHLRVAMAAEGWQTHVDRFPNPSKPDHLASVHFTPMDFVTGAHRARAEAIRRRRTDRLPFTRPARWDSFAPVLRDTVDPSAVVLDVVPDDSRPHLAEASRLTKELRRYDSSYHAELQWWTSQLGSLQGIPTTSRVSTSEEDRLDVSREFPPVGSGVRRSEIIRDHSEVLVLSTYDDSRACALACGEALSTVLLECTVAGLATCTLTHMIEVPAAREIVRMLTGRHGYPQALIRVGSIPQGEIPPPSTPRRPLANVLEIRS